MLPNCLICQQIFTKNFVHSKNLIKWKVLVKYENTLVEVLDFLMDYESFLRGPNMYVLVVDVFSFHLQIFHWFIAPPSRRYFQGHGP
jgi:hypothetical protein